MTVRLEHANLFVREIDATIRFLQTAFPEFRIRFDGRDPRGFRWVHIGTYDTYIALTQSTAEPKERWTPYVGIPGVNHLAYEVDDVEALREQIGWLQRIDAPEQPPIPEARLLLRPRW